MLLGSYTLYNKYRPLTRYVKKTAAKTEIQINIHNGSNRVSILQPQKIVSDGRKRVKTFYHRAFFRSPVRKSATRAYIFEILLWIWEIVAPSPCRAKMAECWSIELLSPTVVPYQHWGRLSISAPSWRSIWAPFPFLATGRGKLCATLIQQKSYRTGPWNIILRWLTVRGIRSMVFSYPSCIHDSGITSPAAVVYSTVQYTHRNPIFVVQFASDSVSEIH